MSRPEHTDTLAAARAEVQQTREELGETVEALAHKADVKGRAHDKAEELKSRAQESVAQVQARAQEAAAKVQGNRPSRRRRRSWRSLAPSSCRRPCWLPSPPGRCCSRWCSRGGASRRAR